MAVRPHTVPFRSEPILKILQEIENEARGPLAKPKPAEKNHLRENVRKIRAMGRQPLKATPEINFQEKSLPRLGPPKTARPPLAPSRSLPQLSQACEVSPRESEDGRCKQKAKSEIGHRPGQLPNYLVERRRRWAEEKEEAERRREEEVPEGYSLLPDEERAETLELLKKNRTELVQSLCALPVRNDTLRLRRCREDLERQLAKVEEGIKIFAKPKVLIKHDL